MAPFFVPTASVVSSIFKIEARYIPAWLVAALVMDEVRHLTMEPLLQDWFERRDVTVPIEEACWGLRTDLKMIRIDPGREMAVWQILLHRIGVRSIQTSYDYKEIWNVVFPPEPQPAQPAAVKWVVPQRATAIVSPPATSEQIAMICGKFGVAVEHPPRVTPKAKPPAPRKKARAIPADPKLAAPDYGACKTVKPKQPKKPSSTEEVGQGQKKKRNAA